MNFGARFRGRAVVPFPCFQNISRKKVDFGLNKRQIFRVITCRSASLLLVERPDSFLSHRETNFPTTEDSRKIFPRKKIGYPKRLAISKFETVLFFMRNVEISSGFNENVPILKP